jgi:hypothetical protein
VCLIDMIIGAVALRVYPTAFLRNKFSAGRAVLVIVL